MASIAALQTAWDSAWEEALATWSRFTKLHPPIWCMNANDEKREGLVGSFAMIRLTDHSVVISLRQVAAEKLQDFALPILAHEIGHHVYAPGDLNDQARLLARIQAGLPTQEKEAPMIANLYSDLLINDRLHRHGVAIQQVYRALKPEENPGKLWTLYMRIYELLWGLQSGTLVPPSRSTLLQADAQLGARLIRVYAKDWLKGAGRFAVLLLPYLIEMRKKKKVPSILPRLLDTEQAGAGCGLPDGLVEMDDDEESPPHPSEDRAIVGQEIDCDETPAENEADSPKGKGTEKEGGKKSNYRDPASYKELMKSLGVKVNEKDLLIRYYRERAIPHLVKFPQKLLEKSADPLPEGAQTWELGDPLHQIDWVETMVRSPYVIPGVTTQQRTWGQTLGTTPARAPLDLYIGIDCSGSMTNPAVNVSWPVLAGTIVTVSALRMGARVMACLSGEPGRYSETDGFLRNEREVMSILTGYLGTGYSYGIDRLRDTFLARSLAKRDTHIMIVSDNDIFYMLKELKNGWEIAEEALHTAGGGGTMILEIAEGSHPKEVARLKSFGWEIYHVRSQEEIVRFARAFSRRHYTTEAQA